MAAVRFARRFVGWLTRNVAPGLAVFFVLLTIVAITAELYLRLTKPFIKTQWISRFDPELGFTFEPGALIRHTNYIDFWSEQRANSWGFLDDEPPPPARKSGTCRIAFVGDSFVEAAQVSIEQKFHRLLEQSWNSKESIIQVETFALGYSGTGQANQLPWAGLIASRAPDLVVLVFVSNDFANNNVWIEAVRNGWHPNHPPRPFIRDGRIFGPDPDWRQYVLPGQTGSAQAAWSVSSGGISGWLHRKLYQKSYLYSALNRMWVHYYYGAPAYYANVPGALAELRKLPGGEAAFGDFNPPADLTLDQMFEANRLPAAFTAALADTREAVRIWKKRAEAMGAKLAILATHTLKAPGLPMAPQAAQARQATSGLLFSRLRQITEDEQILLIDQAEFIRRSGGDFKRASFPFDGHWSEYGHRMAAGTLAEALRAYPELCRRAAP